MNELKDYLLESNQELYHFTNAYNLVNMIKDDEWVTSDDSSGKNFISTTRVKYAGVGYPTQLIDDTNVVRIVLNKRLLNSKFKIVSIDTLAAKGRAIKSNWKDPEVFELYKKEILKQGNVEAEDRVVVNKDSIENFHKYIKEIHINTDNIDSKYITPIESYCEKWDIVFKKYKNEQEFNFARK